jgi:hypothetical protein
MATAPTLGFNLSNLKQEKSWNIDPATQTVAGQLQTVIATDSPLMQQARARALQQKNSSGLLNSSMAISAADSALYDKALEIAKPDAQTYADAGKYNVDVSNTFARDENAFTRQGVMADFDVTAKEWSAVQDFGRTTQRDSTLNDYTNARDITLNTFQNERDDKQNTFTLGRDATQNKYTVENAATQNQYGVARDATQNQYTLAQQAAQASYAAQREAAAAASAAQRDAAQNAFAEKRDASLAVLEAARDKYLAAEAGKRDAAAAEYALARDKAAAAEAALRDSKQNEFTSSRDATAAAVAAERDTRQNTFTSERDAANNLAENKRVAESRLYGARSDFTNSAQRIITDKDLGESARRDAMDSLRLNYNTIIQNSLTTLGWDNPDSWLIQGGTTGGSQGGSDGGDGWSNDTPGGGIGETRVINGAYQIWNGSKWEAGYGR